MGRTLPSITQAFLQQQEAFSRFRRALRRGDQLALDDLFAAAHKHLAAAAYAANASPSRPSCWRCCWRNTKKSCACAG